MEPFANPSNKLGDRNVDCPHYRSCLDHAVKLTWNYWDCSDCQYKLLTQTTTVIDCSPHNAELFYSLPLEIHGKIEL